MTFLMHVRHAWRTCFLPGMVVCTLAVTAGCGGVKTSNAASAAGVGQTVNGTQTIVGRTSPQSTSTNALPTQGTQRSPLLTPNAIPTLVWQAPTTREDGTGLSPNEISQYRIYYKRASDYQYQVIKLTNPAMTELSLSGFASGIYDFQITAVDTQGLESPPSQTVEVTII